VPDILAKRPNLPGKILRFRSGYSGGSAFRAASTTTENLAPPQGVDRSAQARRNNVHDSMAVHVNYDDVSAELVVVGLLALCQRSFDYRGQPNRVHRNARTLLLVGMDA